MRSITGTITEKAEAVDELGSADAARWLEVAQEKQSPNLIVFDFSPEKLTLSANTPDVGLGTEEIPCVYEGRDLRIAFNGKYVLNALQGLACEEVQLDLQDDTRSAMVREYGESNFLHVLMPVRLQHVQEVEQQEVVAV